MDFLILICRMSQKDLQSIVDENTLISYPAIVLYDSDDQDVLVARITTQEYTTETDYKILQWKKCGLLGESYIRLAKLATIEKRFVIKQLGTLKSLEIVNLKTTLRKMFL